MWIGPYMGQDADVILAFEGQKSFWEELSKERKWDGWISRAAQGNAQLIIESRKGT